MFEHIEDFQGAVNYRDNRRSSQPPGLYNDLRLFHAPIPNIVQHDDGIIFENIDPFAILSDVDIEIHIENGRVHIDEEIPLPEAADDEQHADEENVGYEDIGNEGAIGQDNVSVREDNNSNEVRDEENEANLSNGNIVRIEEVLVNAHQQVENSESILNTNDLNNSASQSIDPLKGFFDPTDSTESENGNSTTSDAVNLNFDTVKIEETLTIETNNAEALESLLQEADLSAPCSSSTVQKSGDNQNDDTEDIIWLGEPPKPAICPNYGLVKRNGDRFSGKEPFRDLVNKCSIFYCKFNLKY